MVMQQGFKSLLVWQKSMALAKAVYKLSQLLPARESFGIQSQIQRAAVSVPSNIAEGSRRTTRKEYVHFLDIAYGSLGELESQLLIIQEIYPKASTAPVLDQLDEVSRMLYGLIKKLKL